MGLSYLLTQKDVMVIPLLHTAFDTPLMLGWYFVLVEFHYRKIDIISLILNRTNYSHYGRRPHHLNVESFVKISDRKKCQRCRVELCFMLT